MKTVRTISEIRETLEPLRTDSTVGLVPTMGAFHQGHLSLFRAARRQCDVVVVSLFVNPAQFGPHEDLARYPRDQEADARMAEGEGVDLLFAPTSEEIYPDGFQTWVEVEGLSNHLEGKYRPGHFRGVATICLKLFNIVRPDVAYFGQKDAQQAAIIERMVKDLDLQLEIRVLPTVRDADGLALSSRNVYLTSEQRSVARALPEALRAGARARAAGGDPIEAALGILRHTPSLELDYLEVADFGGRPVLVAGARIGETRLIDNVPLGGGPR